MTSESTAPSLFFRVGGHPFFERLVSAFYEGVACDDVLAPLYPDYPDFGPAQHRLALFLVQYWGGPATYSEHRGHPRLRMRHMPYRVDTEARDAWLRHMRSALVVTGERRATPSVVLDEVDAYFVRSADFLRNTQD